MTNWFLGTMGFSYNDWSGSFYPAYIPSRDYLEYYSRYFNAVEIDSTFYAIPRAEVVERWAEMTPDGFAICAKMPRIITHEMELVGAEGVVTEYLNTMRRLGDKLRVILVQFPPSFTISHFEELDRFLGSLPEDIRYAVEIRHRSWYGDATEKMFHRHQVAWAITEYEDLPIRMTATTDYLYLRFIGRHGRFSSHESEKIDMTRSLMWWWEHLQSLTGQVDSVYGFFNNDYAGFAPATCNRFKEIVGLPAVPLTPPQQPRLF